MIGESLFEGVLSDGDDEDGAGEPGDDSKPEITDSEALLKFHDAERGYWWIKRVYWESGGHAVEWRGVKFDQNKRVVELQVELDKPGDSKSDDTSNEGSEESGEHYAASLVSFPGAGESSEDHGDLEIASSIFRWSAVQEQLSRVREYFGGTSPVSARDMEFVNELGKPLPQRGSELVASSDNSGIGIVVDRPRRRSRAGSSSTSASGTAAPPLSVTHFDAEGLPLENPRLAHTGSTGYVQSAGSLPERRRPSGRSRAGSTSSARSTPGERPRRSRRKVRPRSSFSDAEGSPVPSVQGTTEDVEGVLPPELGSLTQVTVVQISSIGVKGVIPSQIGSLEQLRVLDLSHNELGGAIPKELGRLVGLEKLLLHGNCLVGVIPPALGNLYRLKVLSLQKNKLGGTMPMGLGNLQRLEELRLNSNKLVGEIPAELGDLPCLRRMDLSHNGLVGMVPHEFRQLKALETLDVSHNQLSGLWNGTVRLSVEGVGQEQGEGRVPAELSGLLGWLTELERKSSSTSTPALRLLPNPFHEPPEAVAQAGMGSMRAFFADVFADGVVAERHDVKAMILGQTGGGKTSLRRSIESREPRLTNGVGDSTVLTDVARVDIDGTMVSFYDCTGQVEAHGLLQIFISKRAVCLLVFDTTAFATSDIPSSIKERVDIDIRRLDKLGVFNWLRYLSWRVPGCEVVLVGTKCDLLPEKVLKGLPRRIDKACRRWLRRWATFGLKVIVEGGVNLTSCARRTEGRAGGTAGEHAPVSGSSLRHHHAEPGSADWSPQLWSPRLYGASSRSLLRRITHRSGGCSRRGATMVIPRGWDLALAFLEALSVGRDPICLIESRLKLGKTTKLPDGSGPRRTVKGWITMQKLRAMWLGIVRVLKRCYGVEVRNPLGSLEGALSIREYEGYLLRHDSHVFLDVTWLTEVLKPILHRNEREAPDGTIVLELGEKTIALSDDRHKVGWRRFKTDGVLQLDLARVLWPENDLRECVLPTLSALGLTFPLPAEGNDGGGGDDDDDDDDDDDGLVVLLRLPEDRPESVGEDIRAFRLRHSAVLRAVWSLFLGAPPGAVEKVMARCCGLGRAETYWRFGVLVKGSTRKEEDTRGSFALLVEYSYEQMELVVEVFGAENSAAPWAALAHAMSAVQAMFQDFPGVKYKAHLGCPEHRERIIRVRPEARHPGDSLLDPKSCGNCSRKRGGKGVLAVALLKMTDVRNQSGAEHPMMFREISERYEKLAKLYFWSPSEIVGVQMPVVLEALIEALVGRVLRPLEVLAKGHHAPGSAEHWAEPLRGLEEILRETKADAACRLEDVQRWSVHVRNFAHQRRRTTQALVEMVIEVLECDNGVVTGVEVLARMMAVLRADNGHEASAAGTETACVLPAGDVELGERLSWDERRRGLRGLEVRRKDDASQEVEYLEDDEHGLSSRWRIFLVCGRTYRLVPWGVRGRGYSLTRARKFLGGATGALKFALRVTSEALIDATSRDTSALNAGDRVRVARLEKAMARCVMTLERRLRRLDDVAKERSSPGYIDAPSFSAHKHEDPVMETGASARLGNFIREVEDNQRFEACVQAGDVSRASSTPSFVFLEEVMEQAEGHGGRVQWVMKGLDGTRDEDRQSESARDTSK